MILRQPPAVRKALRRYMTTERGAAAAAALKDYVHYQHTDACSFSRWTARESYEFMYARPWHKIVDFYSNVVKGQTSLHKLFGAETRYIPDDADLIEVSNESEMASIPSQGRKGKWARMTFKIVLSYHGGTFDGWQKQPGLNTVQGLVEESLGEFIDDRKAGKLKEKGLPKEACVVVAGRTDKGVTGFQQVCSFYTWREDVKAEDIEDAINSASPGNLRVISVSKVSRVFHPNFAAKWRRYLYIFPFNDGEESGDCCHNGDTKVIGYSQNGTEQPNKCVEYISEESLDHPLNSIKDELGSKSKPTKFTVSKVNQLLHQLEGKLLSYKMFARDLKPGRNVGPPTECFLFHARATEIILPCGAEGGESVKAMCIELVANRFLRKMVRVLVATSIREAAAGAEDDVLIKLMDATCRRATAPPAPPDGLCLFDVGYKDFDPQTCLII